MPTLGVKNYHNLHHKGDNDEAKLPCKVCGDLTEVIFNIKFKKTPVCESCARAITVQQVTAMLFSYQ